jgi:hypothetical protein
VSSVADDRLTAPEESITRRSPEGRLTLFDCWRDFVGRPTPPIIGSAIAIALAARIAVGHWSWRDLMIPVLILAMEPFTEWAIHVYVLHSKPFRLQGKTYNLPAEAEHREHHEAPAKLDGVLIPIPVVIGSIPLIAASSYGFANLVHLLAGGDLVALWTMWMLSAYAMLGLYEWIHFLIHSPYIPRGRYYKIARRSHRLHHYKNEHFWFGVTTDAGDRVIGTFPDPATVERSATARALHADLVD